MLRLSDRFKRSTQLYMVVIALVIGILGGYGAIGFRVLIQGFQHVAWGTDHATLEFLRGVPTLWIIGTPAVGGLLVGLIVHFFASEAKGHGVPEVMEAVALRHGRIRPRVVVAKSLASSLCIASGGSVGREGPIVQIGAALGSSVGQALKVGPARLRTLTACGAAAGVAGTFNAPVAGALFAVEIIMADFGVAYFSPIVLASVAATVVSRSYLGNFPTFALPAYSLESPVELLAYAALGCLAAFVAIVFIKTLTAFEDGFESLPIPLPIQTAIGGAAVGAMALWFPGVLGVGHEAVNSALNGLLDWRVIAGLLVAKIVAVSFTIGSGGSGGIFMPSLFLGAMLGALVGVGVDSSLPVPTAPVGAYALVGMGALVAASTHAPITAILIIFEMTGSYEVILPLMTSCIIATLLSQRLHPDSIYNVKLRRRGVDIRAHQEVDLLKAVRVSDVMRREPATVEAATPVSRLLEISRETRAHWLYLVGSSGVLEGVVAMRDVQSALPDDDATRRLVVAQDLAAKKFPTVGPGASLVSLIALLEAHDGFEIAVVEEGRLVGTVGADEVLARYRQEVAKRELASDLDALTPVGPEREH